MIENFIKISQEVSINFDSPSKMVDLIKKWAYSSADKKKKSFKLICRYVIESYIKQSNDDDT